VYGPSVCTLLYLSWGMLEELSGNRVTIEGVAYVDFKLHGPLGQHIRLGYPGMKSFLSLRCVVFSGPTHPYSCLLSIVHSRTFQQIRSRQHLDCPNDSYKSSTILRTLRFIYVQYFQTYELLPSYCLSPPLPSCFRCASCSSRNPAWLAIIANGKDPIMIEGIFRTLCDAFPLSTNAQHPILIGLVGCVEMDI
jgi:hypothetical protein